MKNGLKTLSLILGLGVVFFMSSCSDDDEDPAPGDPGGGGSGSGQTEYEVPDGTYIGSISGSDTTFLIGQKLNDWNVETSDFSTMERTGHLSNFIYLPAGNYFFAAIEDKLITNSWSGSTEMITGQKDETGDGGTLDEYMLVTFETGSTSTFNVAAAGVYQVIYDAQRGEAIVALIDTWEILGSGVFKSACESDGFDDGIDLTELSADVSGASWEAQNVMLKNGNIKIRYNDAWKIERRITLPVPDPDNPYDPANGYVGITNFGGTIDALEEGGSDMTLPTATGNGIYTVRVEMSQLGAISMTLTETSAEPEECAFDPANFKWGALGAGIDADDNSDGSGGAANGTPDGWEYADQNFFYKGNVDGEEVWYGVITLENGTDPWKVRTNDAWTFNLGVGADETIPTDGSFLTMTNSGSDIPSMGEGMWFITLKTADQGTSWLMSASQNGWGIIGAATPSGWDSDTDFTAEGTTEGVVTYSITLDMTADEYKIRANDDWALNLGGDMADLAMDGSNLSIAEAGNYTVVFTHDGTVYSVTATKN